MVTDMTHYDGIAELDPDKHRPLFRLVDHLGAIVKAGCLAPAGETVATGIACMRRPRNHPCLGFMLIHRVDVPSKLEWRCPQCGDEGVIRNFRGTIWDIGVQDAERGEVAPQITARVSPAEFAAVRRMTTTDPDSERVIYRARHEAGLIVVSGDEDDLTHLAGLIADEAVEERNARRRADLNAAFDRINSELGPLPWDDGVDH